jgi:hypothetical protein
MIELFCLHVAPPRVFPSGGITRPHDLIYLPMQEHPSTGYRNLEQISAFCIGIGTKVERFTNVMPTLTYTPALSATIRVCL